MQMGTLRGYSVNTPPYYFKGLHANALLAQDPNQAEKIMRCSAMHSWNAGNGHATLRNNSPIDTSGTGIILFTGYQP